MKLLTILILLAILFSCKKDDHHFLKKNMSIKIVNHTETEYDPVKIYSGNNGINNFMAYDSISFAIKTSEIKTIKWKPEVPMAEGTFLIKLDVEREEDFGYVVLLDDTYSFEITIGHETIAVKEE